MTIEGWNRQARKARSSETLISMEERSLLGNPLADVTFPPVETFRAYPRILSDKMRATRRRYKKQRRLALRATGKTK